MKPRVLLIAFEFPPSHGASVQRIFSVYQGFLKKGYDVDVLTAKPHAYVNKSDDLLTMVPTAQRKQIHRAMALDAYRHLAIKGKYLGVTAVPDRWALTWVPAATRKGRRLVKSQPYDIVWSSAPMGSVHFIAHRLVKLHRAIHPSPVTWVADYRDPLHYMHHEGRPPKTRAEHIDHSFDVAVLRHANVITAATPGILALYNARFGDEMPSADRQWVMTNGFMADFMAHQRTWVEQHGREGAPFTAKGKHLYYAGVMYTDGRDPSPVFSALAKLNSTLEAPVHLHFQGSGDGQEYAEHIAALGIDNVVHFHSGVTLARAVRNMLSADGLLLIQDEKFNNQIPGKFYEYLASNRPVIMKTPKHSATAQEGVNYDAVWQGYDEAGLFEALSAWYWHTSTIKRDVSAFSREACVNTMIENIQHLTNDGDTASTEE